MTELNTDVYMTFDIHMTDGKYFYNNSLIALSRSKFYSLNYLTHSLYIRLRQGINNIYIHPQDLPTIVYEHYQQEIVDLYNTH